MRAPLPVVLVPGLNCSARLYAEQVPALWRFGSVQIADHTRDDGLDAIAVDIFAAAPPRFALVALSMGGYAGIPGARLVIVPDSGHLSTLERRAAVTEALVEWMGA